MPLLSEHRDECSEWLNTMGLTECQYLPEDVYAVKAISRISSTGGVRINASLHGCVGGREHTHTSGYTTHTHTLSTYFMLYSHASHLHSSVQAEWWISPLSYTLISTYGMLWNKKVTWCIGLCAWIYLPTCLRVIVHIWQAISILTETKGAASLRCPLFSRGVGEALDGSPCIEILHPSGHSLPGPTAEGEVNLRKCDMKLSRLCIDKHTQWQY